MKRILVFGMTENPGGIESVIMNYYRNIDRSRLQFDFLCNSHNKVAFEEEIIELGGRTFHITPRRDNRSKFSNELDELFRAHYNEWDAIWVNVCSLANIDYLKKAKQYGIKKRIIHSHNSENMDGFLRGVLHKVNRRTIRQVATDFWTCSEDSARWFYDEAIFDKVVLINNAIDVDKYKYNEESRKKIRQAIGVTDRTTVIGNVGRLHFQKNQRFALDVFSEYRKINEDSILVLIGQGEDERELRDKCNELSIKDNVLFAGVQDNVEEWLSAFDLLLFPSLFEGLSVVPIEAQASGVSTIASSKVIPMQLKVNNNFSFYSLEFGAEKWADEIDSKIKNEVRPDYSIIKESLIAQGFDIHFEARKLEDFFLHDQAVSKGE